MNKANRLVLVDGNALFHRAYHAIPHLTNAEGEPTNAVYGFANILLKMLAELKPQYVIVAWDKSSKTFRDEIYPQYKATRKKAPDDLYAQIAPTRELIEALGLPFIELHNYEADDIIGTLAHQAKGLETIIVTGDLDELQLVSETTKVYTMQRGFTDTTIYDLAAMKERYGMTPKQFIDLKALKGDASDNIPGVAGVGEKTAMNLIGQYGSLDGVYEHIDEIKGSLKDKLASSKEIAYLSQELSRIVCDAPIKLDLPAAELGRYDKQAIHELFRRLGFKNLLAKLPPELAADTTPTLFDKGTEPTPKKRSHIEKANYHCIQTVTGLQALVSKLEAVAGFAFDTETDSVDVTQANLVGMSVCWGEGEAYYIPVGHREGSSEEPVARREQKKSIPLAPDSSLLTTADQLLIATVVEALKPFLENEKVDKVGHNLKFDYQIMRRYGVTIAPIAFDTMIASFLMNPLGRAQSLSDLAYSELGIEMIPIEDLIGSKGRHQSTFDLASIEDATRYAAEDADVSWRLYTKMKPQLAKAGFAKLANQMEWPLIPILAEMELAGIELDVDFLKKFSVVITKRILELEAQIWKLAGGEFNIGSPAQLQDVLFNRLGVSVVGVKKGKTGYSTAAGELEKMRGTHPIVELIFEFRELMKLKNTYVDALPELVSPVDGRIHTSFNQTIAQTGRLSSTNPNLQNIPVRTELGREIRKAFVTPKDRVFVSADYSQIELRVAAALAKDDAMIETFLRGIDLHQQTAAELYDISLEKVTKDMRSAAKTINFGVLYGMSAHGLSVATGMSRDEAVGFIKRYFEVRPKLAAYIEDTKEFARKHEYTETLFGRRRPCPEINSNNYIVAAAAERMAVNVPIQGTAADIYKLAMIALAPKLDSQTKLLLQIHDELIAETDEANGALLAKLMKETMENVYDLGVPLAVDTAVGMSWGQLK